LFYVPLIGVLIWCFGYGFLANVQHLIVEGKISALLLFGGICSILPFCIVTFPAITAFLFEPQQHLSANRDGLYAQKRGQHNFIPWSEARLFAVIAMYQDNVIYELASAACTIHWSSKTAMYGSGNLIPLNTIGVSALKLARSATSEDDYRGQIHQLTDLVALRSELPLHDLRS
jgi:hypothetical protein